MDQLQEKVFEKYIEKKPDKLFKRFLVTNRHLLGLLLGGGFAFLRHRKEIKAKRNLDIPF
ncbi:MAG: PEP-CTERM sorting domain-containing protein [Bacteroidetes bacterium]|nr:PEP-CTERM sorting domain-containing protein [Bacteroidota bacterium]